MFLLIALVVILIVFTYSVDSEKRGFGAKKSSSSADPFKGRFNKGATSHGGNHTIDKGQLMRCHQCACFFSPAKVVNAVVEGHLLEFCSDNCRRHFLEPN